MSHSLITQVAAKEIHTVGSDNTLESDVKNILSGVIAALGLACVVVMIIGGVNYMTSVGDTAKVEKGKKTILYGAIGLAICALSFAIVNFTITNIIQSDSHGCPSTEKWDEEKEKCVKK